MRDIASLARVSTATVSHVINQTAHVSSELTERVMRAIRELNYHPNAMARSLRTRQSRTVGMVVPSITNPFFPAVVRGVEDVLSQEGYTLLLGNSDYDIQKEEAYYHTFSAKRVDGLVLEITPTQPPQYFWRHKWDETPVVCIDRVYPAVGGDAVLVDNLAGSYEAVCHLLEAGHRRIGVITGPQQMLMAGRRLRGYKRALRAFGVAIDPELVREGHFDVQSGYEQAKALLGLGGRPTALFVSNGLMTLGALRAILEFGLRCPEDIALVSFDDLDGFELMRPSITAVAQPVYQMGSTAARMLVNRISGKLTGPPRRRLLKTKLIIRESSSVQLKVAGSAGRDPGAALP